MGEFGENMKRRWRSLVLMLTLVTTIAIGLNRYAVLGRSSRLWWSVVPDQASLFAILHA